MNAPVPKYDRKEIGSATVRIPSGTGMPDPLDVAIDPYAPTKVAKQVLIKGFQAWPQKGGPYPAVLILHEWWGISTAGYGPPFWGQAWKPLMNTCLATLVGAYGSMATSMGSGMPVPLGMRTVAEPISLRSNVGAGALM